MQISKLLFKTPNYPVSLGEITHPPKPLYVLGQLPTGPAVAIVGTRRPTAYGKEVTYKLAYDLAKAGITIVSGLAIGIDGVAHQAAVEAGGKAIAVLGTRINDIYPATNRGLAKRVLQQGAIVSEYGPEDDTHRGSFPARNRIISGLSQAVIITEANASSGSLITANFALEQNRALMAVPGNITSERSAGPNNLLKSGAIPVTDAIDVLAGLNMESTVIQAMPVKAKSKEEAQILELLQNGTNTSQALIEQSGLDASQFANIITLMEITGKVRNLGAGQWLAR